MEYLTNRPESTVVSHFISLFLLFFLLLRSIGIHATVMCDRCHLKEIQPWVYVDRSNFNEKQWWLGISVYNEKLICSQRIGVFSEFYEQSPVECTPGRPINAEERSLLPKINKHAECFSNGNIVLCQNPDGTVEKFELKDLALRH